LARLEEQIAQYTKFEQEFKVKLEAEKAEFVKEYEVQYATKLEEYVYRAVIRCIEPNN